MPRPHTARLLHAILLATLLLLPACGERAGSPTATTIGAAPPGTPASPTRPAPPGTPATPRATPASPGTPTLTPTVALQATPLTGAAAILGHLPEATALTILDDWSGFSETSPIERHFSLSRQAERFSGPGRMVVNHWELAFNSQGEQHVRAGEVAVPLDTMQSFLRTLATVPPREGAYKPMITHTDDYPAIDILIATPAGAVWFFTTSNERDNVPWGAVIGGRTYVIDSPIPRQALDTLDRYLTLNSPEDEKPITRMPLPCRADAPAIKPVTSVPAPAKILSPTTAAPSAAPLPRAGQTINLAAWHDLHHTQSIRAYAIGGQAIVEDLPLVEHFVTLLDQPLVVVPSTSLGQSYFDNVTLVFLMSATSSVTLHYHAASGELYLRTDYSSTGEVLYAVHAPEEFVALLLAQLCGG